MKPAHEWGTRLAQPTVTAPIASATKLEQLQDLFAAVELTLSERLRHLKRTQRSLGSTFWL